MLLNTSALLEATVRPEPTSLKLHRKWLADATPEPTEIPAVDVAALKRKYGPHRAHAPRLLKATFQVPLGVRNDTFAKEQSRLIWRWIVRQEQRGWSWCKDRQLQVSPGRYPARDLESGIDILDAREFIVQAWFTINTPKVVRTELQPEWLAAIRL